MRCNYACPLTAGPECPHTKDGADHVPLIFLSSVCTPLVSLVVDYIFIIDKQTQRPGYFIMHLLSSIIADSYRHIGLCKLKQTNLIKLDRNRKVPVAYR